MISATPGTGAAVAGSGTGAGAGSGSGTGSGGGGGGGDGSGFGALGGGAGPETATESDEVATGSGAGPTPGRATSAVGGPASRTWPAASVVSAVSAGVASGVRSRMGSGRFGVIRRQKRTTGLPALPVPITTGT